MADNANTWGLMDLQSLYNLRVANGGTQQIYTAIEETTAEYNRVVNGLLAQWAFRTTVAQQQFELPGSGTLQPMDEWGVPLPVQPSGSYTVAFPIMGGGTGWGANRVASALMTAQETGRALAQAYRMDADWIVRHMLAAIFTNTTWSFSDKAQGAYKGLGTITVQPLANTDTVVYTRKGTAAAAVDEHYLWQAAAIADATNPFPTIYAELNEHPSNTGDIVAYIPTSNVAAVEGLTAFVPVQDPDVRAGVAQSTLSGSINVGFGDRVMGKVDHVWCVEWGVLPANYLIAHATGAGPFLAMREYPDASLQGFFPEANNHNGQTGVSMFRYAGFGVANRVAALAMEVSNGSYAIPTGYTAPQPV